jgi:hypothetical protein
MSGDERGEVAGRCQESAQEGAQERRASEQEQQVAGGSGPAQGAEAAEPEWEDPEEYADPICVCEPEPYWQEVAEQLEREKRARAEASQGPASEPSSPSEPR